jgi:hypothetical protein
MRAGGLARGFVVLAVAFLTPSLPAAQEGLEVVKMVLAEPELDPGAEQLVQVSLRNRSPRAVAAGLRVEVVSEDDRPAGIRRQRRVTVQGGAETRTFIRLKAPRRPGEYQVRLVVLTPNFAKALLVGAPKFFSPFVVAGEVPPESVSAAGPRAPGEPERRAAFRRPAFRAKPGLEFEKPDLLWENFVVRPTGLLVGEALKIKAELRNVGGDIARGINVRATYINTRLPKRVLPLSSSVVDVLAPGEKIELEYEFRFPEDALLGNYRIVLDADSENQVAEADEENNRKATATPIRLSTILLVFPEDGFEFDQTGLFLFRWNSVKYDQFKVQVGTDPRFENKEDYFDLPQGEKWTQEQEIVPLAGELPGMLLGLMIRNDANTAYWRVVGRLEDTDKVGFSLPRPFKIKAELPEQEAQEGAAQASPAQPAAGAPAEDRPSGGTPPPIPPPPGSGGQTQQPRTRY